MNKGRCLLVCAIGAILSAAPFATGVEVRIASDSFGSLVKRGCLVLEGKNHEAGRYIYIDGSKKRVVLTGDLKGINYCLSQELLSKDADTKFLKEELMYFLRSTMSRGTWSLIQPGLVKNLSRNSSGSDLKKYLPYRDLKKYLSMKEPKINGNQWDVEMNFLTEEGGIESWHVSGMVSPLRIDSLSKALIVKEGSFPPSVFVGK